MDAPEPRDAAQLGAPPVVLSEDLLVHVLGEHDVVVDQEDRVARRPVDADVPLAVRPRGAGCT